MIGLLLFRLFDDLAESVISQIASCLVQTKGGGM